MSYRDEATSLRTTFPRAALALALLAAGCQPLEPTEGERDAAAPSPPPDGSPAEHDAGPPDPGDGDAGPEPDDDAGPEPDEGGICGAPALGPTCGDGCAFADGASACPRPASGSQERCDDGNTLAGDGCSPECLVEDGWSCTIAGLPGTCWEEPVYEDLRASSADIVEDRPGLRAASYHDVHLVVAEPLRITIEVESVQLGACPTDVLETPGEAYAELLRVGATADTYVSLDADGSAVLSPGEHRLVVRAGPTRIGRYTVRLRFGPS